jgi:phytoene dehydrogenase-like protein
MQRLLMVGAGTWPGAGVNAISGRLVAQQLIEVRGITRAETALADLASRLRRRGT